MSFVSERKKNNLSQSDVADRLHVSVTAVSLWENGNNMPRAKILPQIADLYGCTIDDLFKPD